MNLKILVFLLGVLVVAACEEDPLPKERSLTQARQIVLGMFKQLDGFELQKQRELNLHGRAAVRMEASWNHAGSARQGIIYVIDNPELFNVVHYTAPAEAGIFQQGYVFFERMISTLRSVKHLGSQVVSEHDDEKILRSFDLQLEIHYPNQWNYSMDTVNRALVFSGPRDEVTWLTTINFSIISKTEQ
jgi:hypothetical protein